MTMILSGSTSDKKLTTCLGRLFKGHPDFETLRGLSKQGVEELLRKKPLGIGLGLQSPDASANGARLWSFRECYFDSWERNITETNILKLRCRRGFGNGKFVRALQAYCCGNRDVLPLDKPALDALRDPLFPGYCNSSDDEIREDIENKLRGESGVSLIDFHELLRFVEQYTRAKSTQAKKNIIIGWNAWRLLCSECRAEITEKPEWIYKHLVKNESIAIELWYFYREVTDP
ncbi:MAG: hypothetical protein WBH01_04980 [Dehalococcoidia bacterium]